MALPAHLSRYDSLIDLIVEQLLREAQDGADMETPAGLRVPAGVNSTHHEHHEHGKDYTASPNGASA